MTFRARSCAAALVFVGLALYTESAHADAAAGARAAPQCTVSVGPASQTGVKLPANTPALLVVEQGWDASKPTLAASFIDGSTRTDLAGTTDSHGLWTLPLPTQTLGTYEVETTTSCPEMPNPLTYKTALTLTAPVDFPTSVGALVAVPSAGPPTGVDKIRFEPTENMRAFLPAAQLQLLVDGAKSDYSTFSTATPPLELTVNTGAACIENGALHREKRTVKVTLEGAIAGVADSPASASVDIEVDCGAIKWTSGLDLDENGNPKPRTSTTPSTSSQPVSSSSSDSGCSASPVGTRGETSGLLAFAIGALGFVAVRRRARK